MRRRGHPAATGGGDYRRRPKIVQRTVGAFLDDVYLQACERHGWTPADAVYVDRGKSGYKQRNGKAANLSGELGAFLQAVKSGQVKSGSILVVENPDRLTRCGFDETYEIIRNVVSSGVAIYWAGRDLMIDSLRNNLPVVIQLAVEAERAYRESQVKSERLRDVWADRRKKSLAGKPHGRSAPKWMILDGDRYKLHAERANVVARMFELAIGGYGIHRIAQQLNADGVPTWTSRTTKWSGGVIASIINSRRVLGEYQPLSGGQPAGPAIENYYPAVVSPETFYRAQRAIEQRKCKASGRQGEKITNLLSGLLVNARDGNNMTAAKGGGSGQRKFSQSVLATYGRFDGGQTETIQLQPVEEGFLRFIRELSAADLSGNNETDSLRTQLQATEGKLDGLQQRKAEIDAAIAAGDGNFATLNTAIQKLSENIAEASRRADDLRAELATAGDQPLTEGQEIIDMLAGATGEHLRDLRTRLKAALRNVIDRAYVLIVVQSKLRRHALIEVHLRSGQVRGFLVSLRSYPRQVRYLMQSERSGGMRWQVAGWPELPLSQFAKAGKRQQAEVEQAVIALANLKKADADHNRFYEYMADTVARVDRELAAERQAAEQSAKKPARKRRRK